jgi:predicted lactoylglutathione lyase
MSRMMFVNLAVGDLPRATAFWRGLGFAFNAQFSDDTAACLMLSDTMFAMLLTAEKFQGFAQVPPADPARTREVLLGLAVESRAEVDRIAEAAAALGGSPHGPPQDHGFMYLRAFADPDGHVWEFAHFAAG